MKSTSWIPDDTNHRNRQIKHGNNPQSSIMKQSSKEAINHINVHWISTMEHYHQSMNVCMVWMNYNYLNLSMKEQCLDMKWTYATIPGEPPWLCISKTRSIEHLPVTGTVITHAWNQANLNEVSSSCCICTCQVEPPIVIWLSWTNRHACEQTIKSKSTTKPPGIIKSQKSDDVQ